MTNLYLRSEQNGKAIALGRNLFRKQILRYGTWKHSAAPNGKLEVTKDLVGEIVTNFNAGVRDEVPVPLGHERDAISSIGQIVGLEQDDEGLWGFHEIADEDHAAKLGSVWNGSSALIELDSVNRETGEKLGAVLIHNAITNAPVIQDLAPFESVALGEDAKDAVVIALQETNTGGAMTLTETLQAIAETPDDELRTALTELRPDMFATANSEDDDEAAIAAARTEGADAVVAALAEKGIAVSLSEDDDAKDPEVDVSSAPEFVALSERVNTLEGEKASTAVTAVVEAAVQAGKILPSQKDGMIAIGLSEGGLELLESVIPEASLVDTSEKGANTANETNVALSEDDKASEISRLASAYIRKAE